jgi:hypothetical protein
LIADRIGVMKEAFIQRSHMLRDLCQLLVANFYEINSVKDTSATSAVTYNQQKDKLATKRKARLVPFEAG